MKKREVLSYFIAFLKLRKHNIHVFFMYCSFFIGVGHNIESGKDFTVDGLSGFSKKKKKKRRHR